MNNVILHLIEHHFIKVIATVDEIQLFYDQMADA